MTRHDIFGLLSGHIIGKSCPLGKPFVQIVICTCIFVISNIAKSEQSSHTPGGGHFNLERKMDKGTDKQYVAEFFIHSTTSHI